MEADEGLEEVGVDPIGIWIPWVHIEHRTYPGQEWSKGLRSVIAWDIGTATAGIGYFVPLGEGFSCILPGARGSLCAILLVSPQIQTHDNFPVQQRHPIDSIPLSVFTVPFKKFSHFNCPIYLVFEENSDLSPLLFLIALPSGSIRSCE